MSGATIPALLREIEAPGDRLWVRENFWQACSYPCALPSGEPEPHEWTRSRLVHYAADGKPRNTPNRHYPEGLRGGYISAPDPYATWESRPSIHMPRWASRITLLVDAVRVERLQDISEADAVAEGARKSPFGEWTHDADKLWFGSARDSFSQLWTHLHGPDAWDANPWVCAITFRPVLANIDTIEVRHG